MVIKPSTVMRNDYNQISAYAHQTGEIIYLTKRGKGDLVVMSIDTFAKREEQLRLHHTVAQAEKDRQENIGEIFDGNDVIAKLKERFIE